MESLDMRGRGVRGRRSPRVTTKPFINEDKGRKILVPTFNPFIDPIIEAVFGVEGLDVETLPPPDKLSVKMGLKYVNNDICYPATIDIGDIINALRSEQCCGGDHPDRRTVQVLIVPVPD